MTPVMTTRDGVEIVLNADMLDEIDLHFGAPQRLHYAVRLTEDEVLTLIGHLAVFYTDEFGAEEAVEQMLRRMRVRVVPS